MVRNLLVALFIFVVSYLGAGMDTIEKERFSQVHCEGSWIICKKKQGIQGHADLILPAHRVLEVRWEEE